MSIGSSLLNFAARHPVVTSAPLIGGGAILAGRTADDPDSFKRRALLGGLAGGAAALAIPGVRQAIPRFLGRQFHALTGYVPKSFKASPAVEKAVAEAASKGGKAINPGQAQKYWASLQPLTTQTSAKELARSVAAHEAGMSTLPGIVKNLRHPTTFAKKWWTHTPTTDKLMLGGFGAYGVYSGAKSKEPGAVAGSLGDTLGWGLTAAGPVGLWLPASHLMSSGFSRAAKAFRPRTFPRSTQEAVRRG